MRDTPGDTERLASHVRVMQIIVSAMMMGIIFFLGIVVFLGLGRAPNVDQQAVLTMAALGFFALAIGAWAVVPDTVVKRQVQRIAADTWTPGMDPQTGKDFPAGAYPNDASKLLVVNQTRVIIAAALLEGAAFFGCIAYLLEGRVFALAIPGVVCALLILTFPTRDRVRQWVDRQEIRVADWRSEPSY